jgi:biotin carboxylase
VRQAPLLVLGAGEDQLPLYREAGRRGIPTIGVDQNANRPAVPLADEFLPISTRDHRDIHAALAGREISGVVTAASDASLESVVELTRQFGVTPWLSGTAAATSLDKAEFHRVTAAAGIPAPAWYAGGSTEDWQRVAGRLGYPLVLKPVDASGSFGASLIAEPAELEPGLAVAVAASPSGTLIAEQYVAGRNLTVELFFVGGRPALRVVSEKVLGGPTGFLICGHRCPADLGTEEDRRVAELALAVADAMEVRDGPLNIDVILPPNGSPIVLEAGARLCGNAFPRLVREMSGADTIAAMVSLGLGEPVRLTSTRARHGQLRVLASPLAEPARVLSVDGLAQARTQPGVVFADVYVDRGDLVQPFLRAAYKMGYIGVVGDSAADADSALRAALSMIRIELSSPVPVSSE